jgi:hypothetical protein
MIGGSTSERSISLLLLLMLVPATVATVAPQASAAPTSGLTFHLAVGEGQSLSDAVQQLRASRPQLEPTINAVLHAQSARMTAGRAATGTYVVSGQPAAASSTGYAEVKPQSSLLSGYLTFSGSLTITGYVCSPDGCAPQSTLTHSATWDQGYGTVRVNSKSAASNNPSLWTNRTATTFCRVGSITCSYGLTFNLWAASTYNREYISQSPSTMTSSKGRWLITFTASYFDSPGGLSGWTPYILCSSSQQQCKWQ